jgi:diaminohydroxyphosphoribosylaminopyrimidine deaminase/5-amino-6-(5-phosphoribosylamino)uracil reductase
VNALAEVEDESVLKDSTAYVSLEPCSHHGKTPPCAHLLVEKGIREVVVCNFDPNPLVSGKGIQILEKAEIRTEVGILENLGQKLNRFFFKAQEKKRPFVTLKWAQTADGFIARKDGSSKWISSEMSRLWVHKWRASHQAILVGKNTLIQDNPTLNVRNWVGPNPVRIVLDPDLSLPPDLNVFTDPGSPTWIFSGVPKDETGHIKYFLSDLSKPSLPQVLETLWKSGIHSLFVEGGSSLLKSFIDQKIWDEALVFTSDTCFGDGLKSPELPGAQINGRYHSGDDILECWVPGI